MYLEPLALYLMLSAVMVFDGVKTSNDYGNRQQSKSRVC